MDGLVGWLVGRPAGRSVALSVRRSIGVFVICFLPISGAKGDGVWCVHYLIDWLIELLVGRSAGLSVGRSVGRSVYS